MEWILAFDRCHIFFLTLICFFSGRVQAESLSGTWKSLCEPYGRHAIIYEVTFDERNIRASGYLYEKPGCKTATVKSEFRGWYQVGSSVGEAQTIVIFPETLTLNILREEDAEIYRRGEICQIHDWRAGQARDIIGKEKCVGIDPPRGRFNHHDLFQIRSKKTVRFANFPLRKLAETEAQRPSRIPADSWVLKKTD